MVCFLSQEYLGGRRRLQHLTFVLGFPGGSDGKEFSYSAGDPGSIPGSGRYPGEGHGNPLQYSCLENPMDKRNLVSFSPWGCKESDMTEGLSIHIKDIECV